MGLLCLKVGENYEVTEKIRNRSENCTTDVDFVLYGSSTVIIRDYRCRADYEYFRGGGFSSHFKTEAEMPLTMIRLNLVDGVGPTLQIAEGYSVVLDEDVHDTLDKRTDPTWPTTWFAPILTGKGAFTDVYSVMAAWGANHGVTVHGHVGADIITLASMLRIPVAIHNVAEEKIYRPHSWAAFGKGEDSIATDYRACEAYGPLFK